MNWGARPLADVCPASQLIEQNGVDDMTKKLLIIGLILTAIVAAVHFGLLGQLTLANLKNRQAEFDALYRASPVFVLACFFALYVAVTGLSLPGAAIMTLAAGALFGVVTGTILVSFASTIGATLAFLASRHVLRDMVQRRFGDRLTPINDGVAKDGAFYLLTLRLVPLFPFFLINLLMGLTPIRTSTYFWVSQIGMLLGTIVYVNAGTQLAKITTLSGIASPALIGSFIALGLMPWVAKWIVKQVQSNRAA
jgi:uncharacterized membrane protein YdjX (TVP38/TMEM64 family)